MNPKSPTDIIRLPSTFAEQNHVLQTLKETFNGVQDPSELDAATNNVGMPASLLNFYFATHVDLSPIGLGSAVHIPIQVTEREGGRKSIYSLDQNEEVLTGLYVTGEGVALRFVKRVTGSGLPPQIGDVYSTRITNLDGELVFEEREVLQRFDSQTGQGHFVPVPSIEQPHVPLTATATPKGSVCLLWSTLVYQPDWW